MALISIVTPCFNELENVERLHHAVRSVMSSVAHHEYEHVFIDNASTDGTVEVLRRMAQQDPRVKVILNLRNFGPWSPLHAFFQVQGDAIVYIAADFQDPPDLIPAFIERWDAGFKIVAAVKVVSNERFPMKQLRGAYYRLIDAISETDTIRDFTGFGLYDRRVIEIVRSTGDNRPYFRGLICQIGYPIATVGYTRPTRKHGRSKNRLYDLYSQAMNGITAQSKVPLRVATFAGLVIASMSLLVAVGYFVYKLLYWDEFSLGVAPIVCGFFFLAAVQMMFLGILGEYLGAIHERVFQKWLVIERERINFDEPVQDVPARTRSVAPPSM